MWLIIFYNCCVMGTICAGYDFFAFISIKYTLVSLFPFRTLNDLMLLDGVAVFTVCDISYHKIVVHLLW